MHRLCLAIVLLFLSLAPQQTFAAASEWQHDEALNIRLISDSTAIGQNNSTLFGIELKLAPNWHTYWRSPGDAGTPPQLDWQNGLGEASNIQNPRLLYPAPTRYTAYGLETIGYRDHVVFPLQLDVLHTSNSARVNFALDILVCSDICVPKHFNLKLELPAGETQPSAEHYLITAAMAELPLPPESAKIQITDFVRMADHIQFTVRRSSLLTAPDAFVENDKNVNFAAPEIKFSADKLSAVMTIKMVGSLSDDVKLADLPLTITITDRADPPADGAALEQKFDPQAVNQAIDATPPSPPAAKTTPANTTAPPPTTTTATPPPALFIVMFLAFFGGFILNLMPCVLPVLSLKILGVVSHGGGQADRVRRSFLTTAAGILFSFLVLAVVTVTLKATGQNFGWGIQFQQPAFLIFLITLLLLFAANLLGLYEIPLPRFLADRLDPTYHPKLAGDFATGAFATLLATPCTAPLLGTAIGFALAAGSGEIIIVFLALGAGMALPYFIIAIWPHFATRLPRPGAWMVKVRQILGLALLATGLWLGFVLSMELMTSPTNANQIQDAGWQKFDEAALVQYISQGKIVFVDVTADWCLTCKANKRLVLNRDDVTQALLRTPNVVAMQADWTKPDAAIASFLQQHQRYGIPFNAVFSLKTPNGMVLPELLTASIVLDALEQAKN